MNAGANWQNDAAPVGYPARHRSVTSARLELRVRPAERSRSERPVRRPRLEQQERHPRQVQCPLRVWYRQPELRLRPWPSCPCPCLLCRLIEERLTGVAQFVLVLQKAVARLSASRLKVFAEFLPIFLADGARFCRVGGGGQSRHAKNGNHGQQDEVLHHSCELQGSENRWCIVKPAIGQQAPKVNKSRLPGARTL